MLAETLAFAVMTLPWFVYAWVAVNAFGLIFLGWGNFDDNSDDGFWHIFSFNLRETGTSLQLMFSSWFFTIWMKVWWQVDPLLVGLFLSVMAACVFRAFFVRVRLTFFVNK